MHDALQDLLFARACRQRGIVEAQVMGDDEQLFSRFPFQLSDV